MAFRKGQSGNPTGRPRGKPNKATTAIRQRIETEADPVAFLAKVMSGAPIKRAETEGTYEPTLADMIAAARVLAGKLVPDAKDKPVLFEVGQINGPVDALSAIARLVEAMGRGELTPSEAATVINVVEAYRRTWEATDLERRVADLEKGRA
jgi:hypothetical protein